MDEYISTYPGIRAIFDKISDSTRVVDPMQKKVVEYGNNESSIKDIHCFDFWGKNTVCDNCISMRAYNSNATYVKLEYIQEKTYMITAVPHDLEDRRVVIEILKDITSSMVFDAAEVPGRTGSIHTLIDNMNKLAFADPLTGLYNRRYIMEKLPVDLLNSALLSKELSVIMATSTFLKR
jgi:hypothetical protein